MSKMKTSTKVLIGVGVLATAGGVAYYLYSKGKKVAGGGQQGTDSLNIDPAMFSSAAAPVYQANPGLRVSVKPHG
jgi:hypothetical protein